MKKVFSVLCAILIASSMIVSAFAAAVSSPKIEPPKVTEIVIKDAEGNVVTTVSADDEGADTDAYVVLNALADEEAQVSEEVAEEMENAYTALTEMKSLGEILPEYEGKEPLEVMNVSFSEEIAAAVEAGGSVAVKTDVKMNLEKGTRLPIIRYIDGQWVASEDEYAEVLEDGTVVIHVNQSGTFSILVDPETEILKDTEESK